jgi:AraC-like DNA-binding protein
MQPYALVRPGDSFETWHHATCRNYSTTQSRGVPDQHFRASVRVRPFGPVAISEIASELRNGDQLEVTRSPADIRRDPRDDFLLWIARSGTTWIEQDGRTAVLAPGDLALHDQARPFSLTFASTSAAIMVVMPRACLTARVPGAERMVAQRIARDMPLARLSATLARQVARSPESLTDATADRLCDAALDIWSTLLDSSLDHAGEQRAARDTAATRRLREVKRYMLARLGDPDLDTVTIAHTHHVSTRTLIRMFAAEGVTPMRWLLAQRLRATHEALSNGSAQSVTDAALAFGFSDLSHFSRCFRAAYGQTAQAVLRRR